MTVVTFTFIQQMALSLIVGIGYLFVYRQERYAPLLRLAIGWAAQAVFLSLTLIETQGVARAALGLLIGLTGFSGCLLMHVGAFRLYGGDQRIRYVPIGLTAIGLLAAGFVLDLLDYRFAADLLGYGLMCIVQVSTGIMLLRRFEADTRWKFALEGTGAACLSSGPTARPPMCPIRSRSCSV